jgi:hypothetical protein
MLVVQKNAAAAAPQNNEELGLGIRPNPNPPGYHASIHSFRLLTSFTIPDRTRTIRNYPHS